MNTCFNKNSTVDGWRDCLRCGKRGIKDTFYGRNKDFCSVKCSRFGNSCRDFIFRFLNQLPMIKANASVNLMDLTSVFESYEFAPVHAFKHIPLSRCWETMFQDDQCTVEIVHESTGEDRVWFAEVLSHKGYFLKVKLIGKERFYFLNPGVVNIHPVGYALKNKKRYGLPFKNHMPIEDICKIVDDKIINHKTINMDLYNMFTKETMNDYENSVTFEVIDKSCPDQFLTGKVRSTFGDWVYVKYDLSDEGIWVHPVQGFFRPPAWCQLVGHPIRTTSHYVTSSVYDFTRDTSVQKLFSKHLLMESPDIDNKFEIGMKLEVLDPFDHLMRIGTVENILRYGFIMIKFDHDDKTLCYHITSSHLYPPGFSDLNGILIHDADFNQFHWSKYKMLKNESLAPSHVLPKLVFDCNLKEGMIVETFNLRGHGVISYAIILRVIGRLVLIDFIHHSFDHGLLVDCDSPCLFPVGHSQMISRKDRYIKYDWLTIEEFQENVRMNLNLVQMNQQILPEDGGQSDQEQLEVMPDIPDFSDMEDSPVLNYSDITYSRSQHYKEDRKLVFDYEKKVAVEPINPIEEVEVDQFIAMMENNDQKVKQQMLTFKDNEKSKNDRFNLEQTFELACERNSDIFSTIISIKNINNKNYLHWTVEDVSNLLRHNFKLSKYVDNFIINNIDGLRLFEYANNYDKLKTLIEPVGDQLKLRFLVEKVRKQFDQFIY